MTGFRRVDGEPTNEDGCCFVKVDGQTPGGGPVGPAQPSGYFFYVDPANNSTPERGIPVRGDFSQAPNTIETWVPAPETGNAAISVTMFDFRTVSRTLRVRLYLNLVQAAVVEETSIFPNYTTFSLGSHALTQGDIISTSIEALSDQISVWSGFLRVEY